jgi:hypothetical protein
MIKALMIAAAAHTVQNKKAPLIPNGSPRHLSIRGRTNQGIAISSASRKANHVQAQADLVTLNTPPNRY